MSDIPLTGPIAPNPGSQAQSTYAKYVSEGFINVADHAARDALHTGVTTVGTLVRTRNDGVVWEVTGVAPVVYSPWFGPGGRPFNATFYVDPAFTGLSNGSQSAPYTSITAVFAVAPSTGALIILAPYVSTTENLIVPGTGTWEVKSEAEVASFIVGNISFAGPHGVLTLDSVVVTGTITGTTTTNSYLILINSNAGVVTLGATGSGFWNTVVNNPGVSEASGLNSHIGALSVVGRILGSNCDFTGAVSSTAASLFSGCYLNNLSIGVGGSLLVRDTVFAVAPTFTGAAVVTMDGFSHASAIAAGGITLAGGATLVILNDVNPSGITQSGATLHQSLAWNGTAYAPANTNSMTALPNIAAMVAYDFTGAADGSLVVIDQPEDLYVVHTAPSSALVAGTDGINVVQPTTPNTIRLARRGLAYSYVSDWYVDSAAGNDTNDGSITHPLKNWTELAARLCPGGVDRTIYQAVNLHVAAGTYAGAHISFSGPFAVKVLCAFTSSASFTITVVNPVAGITTVGSGTRGQITVSSFTLAPLQMLRCTTGARAGATCMVLELNGDAQHAFTTPWKDVNGNSVQMVNGDTVVVDTSTVDMDHLDLEVHSGATISVQYFGSATTKACGLSCISDDVDAITFLYCRGAFTARYSAGAHSINCAGSWLVSDGFWSYQGTTLCSKASLFEYCSIELRGADVLWGSGMTKFGSAYLELYAVNMYIGASEFGQGDAHGLEIEQCGDVGSAVFSLGGAANFTKQSGFPVWGVTGALPNGVVWNLVKSCKVYIQDAQLPTAPGLIQIIIGEFGNCIYADIPISDRGADAYFFFQGHSNEGNLSGTFSDVMAAASIIAVATPNRGLYRLDVYLVIKIAGTLGSFAAFVSWTDTSGTAQKQQITAYQSIQTLAAANGSVCIWSNGSAQIQLSVEAEPSHTFTKGSLSYDLGATLEKKSVNF